ncbi:MAG TPA: hypothetical protein VGP12_10840 [Nitrosospira sp.]|jgi:hypothetical protein|nr:hypothetical protein [Nitrosospira sp.]
MLDTMPQVGAQDPELNNSPVLDEDEAAPDLELEVGTCYFNNVAFRIGQYVRSGSELLRCEEGGVWVRKDEVGSE